MNGTILGMTRREIDAKLDEIVDFSGVEKYIDTPVKFYSSGMRVRVGFAVAAHLEPEILIIDEVLAVGDAEFQKKCLGKMQEVAETDGRTVLFVSHNMVAVESLCNRCILLNHGAIISNDKTSVSVNHYRMQMLDFTEALLNERTDREGSGEVRFTKLVFNHETPVISGGKLVLDVYYTSQKELKSVQLAITICRNFDERILVIDSKSQGINIEIIEGEGMIEITIPKLYLLPSSYSVNLWLASGNIVLDYIINVGKLEVNEADVFGTGNMLNTQKHGVFFTDTCEWETINN